MAEEKKNPLIGAFRSAPAKDQEPPGSKAAEPEKAVVLSKEKAKPAEKPVEKNAEKPAPAYAVKPGKAEEKPVAAPAEKRDEKKPEEKPSAAPAKPEDKKAAASAKAEEKKPAEDKGAEGMHESKKETEKKDQTDADGIPEDFRLNIVGEGTLGSVVMLPVEKIDDFEGHPFPVQDDKDMLDLVESIKKFGVLEPVTVIRSGKDPERYEMVAGHRRKHGCALAGVAQIQSTMRSRNIMSTIVLQNISGLKALFKDDWEGLLGNADTLLYLGGNEQSTHKYISEMLGKETLDVRHRSTTRGRNGSDSVSRQQLARELMTPDEVRSMDNRCALLFIRGEKPVMDEKYDLLRHPNLRRTADGGAAPYVHKAADYACGDMRGAFVSLEELILLEGFTE